MNKETLLSQYANSPRLLAIISGVWDALDSSLLTDGFFAAAMDIRTANSWGLDCWGRIVGIGRTVNTANPSGEYFGFTNGFYPFNERPFSGSGSSSSAWELADDAYRELIFLKALANIVYATAPNINRLMAAMFEGKAYCLLSGHMEMTYVFEFALSPFERHLIYNTDILPRPCGVLIRIIMNLEPENTFGFSGQGLQPFNYGTFHNGSA